jgi:hypothetical protein
MACYNDDDGGSIAASLSLFMLVNITKEGLRELSKLNQQSLRQLIVI